MQQLKEIKILIFFTVFICSVFSNDKNQTTKTSCEIEDCKIQVKLKEKNRLQNFHTENVLSVKRNLNKIKNQSFQNYGTQTKWEERIERKLYEEESLKAKEQANLKEIYNKEMKFSATGN